MGFRFKAKNASCAAVVFCRDSLPFLPVKEVYPREEILRANFFFARNRESETNLAISIAIAAPLFYGTVTAPYVGIGMVVETQ